MLSKKAYRTYRFNFNHRLLHILQNLDSFLLTFPKSYKFVVAKRLECIISWCSETVSGYKNVSWGFDSHLESCFYFNYCFFAHSDRQSAAFSFLTQHAMSENWN